MPDTDTIEIEIAELHWERYEPRTDGAGVTVIQAEITPGPWRFTVALHSGRNAAASPGGHPRLLDSIIRALRALWPHPPPATPQR